MELDLSGISTTEQPPYINESNEEPAAPTCLSLWETHQKANSWLLLIGPAMIISVGTTGNTIAYFVLKQKAYKNNVMASALRYLAVLDNVILWSVVLRLLLMGAFGHDLALASRKSCFLNLFYTLLITSCDNWLLVQITLTRLIHLKCPYNSHTICSKFNYYVLLFSTHIMIAVLHGGSIFSLFMNLSEKPLMSCYILTSEEEASALTTSITNVTINFMLPGLLLLLFNFLIAQELQVVSKRENELHCSVAPTMSAKHISEPPTSTDMDNNFTHNALEYQAVSPKQIPVTSERGHAGEETGNAASEGHDLETPVFDLRQNWKEDIRAQSPRGRVRMSARGLSILRSTRGLRRHASRGDDYETGDANLSQNALFSGLQQPDDSRMATTPIRMMSARQSFMTEMKTSPSSKSVHHISTIDDIPTVNFLGTASGTTIKSFRRSTDSRAANRGRWATLERVSVAWSQPVDMDVEYSRSPDLKGPSQEDVTVAAGQIEAESVSDPPLGQSITGKKINESLKRDSRIQSLTRLLMMASAVFICLNLPYWTFHLIGKGWMTSSPAGCYRRYIILHVVLLLRYSNHSVNFFFYCASGTRFRQELYAWLRTWGRGNDVNIRGVSLENTAKV